MPRRRLSSALIALPLMLAGCTAVPAPAETTAAADAPSPTPTATVAAPGPKVPFDGDCASVLPGDVTADIFDGTEPTVSARTYIGGVMPDLSGSLAGLGGLTCSWSPEGAENSYLALTVVPMDAVPTQVAADRAEFGCYDWFVCGRGEARSGMWVLAEVPASQDHGASPENDGAKAPAVDAAIAAVFARPSEDYAGRPAPASPDRWRLPACESLEAVATSAAGMTSPEVGVPGDNGPEGPVWEIMTAAGLTQWCPWYELGDEKVLITELQMQSGIGAPSATQLEAVDASAISIPGADAAYRLGQAGPTGSGVILVVDGTNRLLVRGDEPEAVAAAILPELGP